MQHDALFPAIAEIGATIAGFSGVIALFRRGTTPSESDPEVFTVRDVVRISLMVAAFALLPFVPDGLDLGGTAVWRVCSLLLAVFVLLGMVASLREVRREHGIRTLRENPVPPWILLPIVVVIELLLCANALAYSPKYAATFYLAALLLLLVLAGLFFLTLLVPPRR